MCAADATDDNKRRVHMRIDKKLFDQVREVIGPDANLTALVEQLLQYYVNTKDVL